MKTVKKSTTMFLLFLYTIIIFYTWEMVCYSLENYFVFDYGFLFWCIVFLIGYSYGIPLIFYKYLPKPLSDFFTNVSTYWMAFLLYCFIIFPMVNAIIFFSDFNRETNVEIAFDGFLVILIMTLLTSVKGTVNAIIPHIVKFEVKDKRKKLKESINVVLISDIHLGITFGRRRLIKMVEKINFLKPDIILIAGDIVDSDITPFLKLNLAKEFAKLRSTYGTYAVLGNHDMMMGKADEIAEELSKNGVNVLRDEKVLINNDFYLIGRDDIISEKVGSPRKNIEEVIGEVDDSKYKMLIDHNPKYSYEAEKNNIDIQFSGHTHKGQMRPWAFAVKRMYEIDHGYLRRGNFNLFVSSGYGTCGPRLRTGSKAEIIQVIVS